MLLDWEGLRYYFITLKEGEWWNADIHQNSIIDFELIFQGCVWFSVVQGDQFYHEVEDNQMWGEGGEGSSEWVRRVLWYMTYLRLPGMVMITMITRNPHNKTELFLNNLGYIQLIQPSVEISFLRTVLNFFSFHSIENLGTQSMSQ